MWSNYFNYSENQNTDTTKSTTYGKTFLKMFKQDKNSVPKISFTFKDCSLYVSVDNRDGKCLKKAFKSPYEALDFAGISHEVLK